MVTPFEKAVELIDKGNNIFITGGGGVGKSYLLNQLKEYYGDKLHLTSTTGVSALNIGGQTINSWALIGTGDKPIDNVIKRINRTPEIKNQIISCELLAIDEISMLSNYTIIYLNDVLSKIRKCNKPFGGIQVIFIGDFFQLPPVKVGQIVEKNGNEWLLDFCFNTDVWKNLDLTTLYLKEVKRQSDKDFINTLNRIRIGKNLNDSDKNLLNTRSIDNNKDTEASILHLFSASGTGKPFNPNLYSNHYNNQCYRKLNTEEFSYNSYNYLYRYNHLGEKEEYFLYSRDIKLTSLEIEDKKEFEKDCKAPKLLKLKEGARVMLLKNIDVEKGLVNGACGIVEKLTHDSIKVLFDNGYSQQIEKMKFEYIRDGKVTIVRKQYPLMLAYGITIHKSQGMTFDKLVINLNNIFSEGMGYVALSRITKLEGLYIKGLNFDIKDKRFKANDDVKAFDRELIHSDKCIIFGEYIENISNDASYQNTVDEDDLIDFQYDAVSEDRYNNSEKDEKFCINDYTEDSFPNIESCIYLSEAQTAFDNKNYDTVISICYTALKEDENNCDLLDLKAKAHHFKNEYNEAVNTWNKILSIDKNYPVNYFQKAYAEDEIGQLSEALNDMNYYIETLGHTDDSNAYNNRGWLYEQLNELDNAKQDYQQALKINPENETAKNNLTRIEEKIEEELKDESLIQNPEQNTNDINNPENTFEEKDKTAETESGQISINEEFRTVLENEKDYKKQINKFAKARQCLIDEISNVKYNIEDFLYRYYKKRIQDRVSQIKDYQSKIDNLSKEANAKQNELNKARKDLETLTKGFNKAKSGTEKGRYAPLISDTEALINKLEKEHQAAKEKNASKIDNYDKIIRSLENRKNRESDLAGQYDTSLTGKIKKGLTLINKGAEPAIRKTQIDKIINRALQSDRARDLMYKKPEENEKDYKKQIKKIEKRNIKYNLLIKRLEKEIKSSRNEINNQSKKLQKNISPIDRKDILDKISILQDTMNTKQERIKKLKDKIKETEDKFFRHLQSHIDLKNSKRL